jgi:hypothetical protein
MPAPRLRRLLLLLLCLLGGSLVGAVGHGLSGDGAWFLALPLALAVGWWAVADPGACLPTDPRDERPRR